MLEQALFATEILEKNGTFCTIITIFDYGFEQDLVSLTVLNKYSKILVLENYLPGNLLFNKIRENVISEVGNLMVKRVGLNEFPKCGQNNEILLHHNLDAQSIARLFLDDTTWA
jgi:transketolase C-terminal domain/subunit